MSSSLQENNVSLPVSPTHFSSIPLARPLETDRAAGTTLYTLTNAGDIIWSPDGKSIASFEDKKISIWHTATGTCDLIYNEHLDEVLSVKWSPDSQYLASAGFDCTVRVWDALRGQTFTTYRKHCAWVRDIVWSPDANYIASAGYDKTVQVWEAMTGQTIIIYRDHTEEIRSLTWSPDASYIASTDMKNTTKIWKAL